jgi:heparan-sulfate lyase
MNGIEDAFPASYLSTIEKMCEVPMKLCMPDGTNVQFGDAWAGSPGQHAGQFLQWAEFFGREDFLFLATNGKEGTKPGATAYALKESGLYSMRSGWGKDDICLVLKCGPDGGGHCQPDNGTFELYAGGRNLMPDAGSYIYSGNPEGRAWFRQTKVHQTLTLNGENSRYDARCLLWAPADSLDILVAENASYEGLTHRRAVFFVDKKYFILVDEAFGKATGDVRLHFQLAPGEALFSEKEFSVNSAFEQGWNVLVRANPQKGMKLEEEEGQVSFKYTMKEPRPAFCYRMNKEPEAINLRFITLVAPFNGSVPNIKIELIGNPEIGSSAIQLEIEENGKKKTIGYSL